MKANEPRKPAIDLLYAYALAAFGDQTVKMTGFSSGDKLSAFVRKLYDVKGLPNLCKQKRSTLIKDLIQQVSLLVSIDDFFFMSISKPHIQQLINKFMILLIIKFVKCLLESPFSCLSP